MKYLLLIIALLLPVAGFAQQTAGLQKVTSKEVEQVLNDFLTEQSDALPHVEFHYSSLDLPDDFQVPAGAIEFEVLPSRPGVIGSSRMTLLTRVDGQIVDNRSIRVDLESLAEILIATDNLHRGALLSADNVEFRKQDISRLKEPLFALDDVYGKRLKRSVRLGQPLSRNEVEFPPVIKRGDRVTIHAQRGSLELSAAGEAKDDGLQGETIRVMNLGSRKVVLCSVVEAGLVKVEF